MKKDCFVVLEDVPDRVEWLKQAFPDIRIVWSEDMNPFLQAVETEEKAGTLKAIIMDHDLGFFQHANQQDLDGYNGSDAARFLELRDWDIPIIIWSMNSPAAVNMEEILREKGFGNIKRIMFMFKVALVNALEKALTRG